MKSSSRVLIFAGAIPALLFGLSLAEDPPAADPVPGEPPPPPRLVIEAEDILSSKTEDLGDREVTVQRVTPIALPPPPEPAPPPGPLSPEMQQRLQEFSANFRETTVIFAGATVYRSASFANGPRTLVQFLDRESQTTCKLWSSADWRLLSRVGDFQGADGHKYRLMMTPSDMDLDRWAQFMAARGRPFVAPVIPEIPAGNATFVVAEGSPSPAALAGITALHQLYNTELASLQVAHAAREQAHLQQTQQASANPPQPKNLVIRHWRMDEAGQS